jgi:hypothetical protein
LSGFAAQTGGKWNFLESKCPPSRSSSAGLQRRPPSAGRSIGYIAHGHRRSRVPKRYLSIEAFLSWLDIDQESKWHPQYAPVQWKLAMEVCRRLVLDAGMQLGAESNPIRLRVPDRTTSPPLHESFIIYHVDELIAIEPIVHKARAAENEDRSAHELSLELGQTYPAEKPRIQKDQPKIPVTPQDIQKSHELRQQIVALLEGAMLRRLNVSEPKSAQPPPSPLARQASRRVTSPNIARAMCRKPSAQMSRPGTTSLHSNFARRPD